MIDKIRKGFTNLQRATDKKQMIKVSFSVGLAAYPVIKSWPDLIKTADKKLYDAKRKGCNCTVLNSKK